MLAMERYFVVSELSEEKKRREVKMKLLIPLSTIV